MTETASMADREIVITRELNAPRELVFQAWTEPQHVVQWWGPRGFTNTIHEMDIRLGRLAETADLTHELQRGRADLVLRHRWLEVKEGFDISAHSRHLRTGCSV